LLPVVAGFLLWMANKESVLGRYTNSHIQNLLGLGIIAITAILGLKGVLATFDMQLI